MISPAYLQPVESDRNQRLTVVLIADMPQEAAVAFRDYEDQVLPLLSRSTAGAKQGAAFGYTKVRGYHPQLATCAQTGQVLMSRLRGGSRRRPRRELVPDRDDQPSPQRRQPRPADRPG